MDRFLGHSSFHLFDTHICAIGVLARSGSCFGNSGGPLICETKAEQSVSIALMSFGLNSCGLVSSPAVFTRVESFIDWILYQLED
ncbi:AGAP009220-PA-like protein [Anopheles sinensis]|uniref:AGAP009220-PA-like protein n=1 Tax=Anopheles sinensis TaxID=74873 RepID=A0A084W6P3_ANOSI|nr:AGAP009220-PA-like protein [Anopheles sinensis]